VGKKQPVQAEDPVQSLELSAQGKLEEHEGSSQEPADLADGYQPGRSPAVLGNLPGVGLQSDTGRTSQKPGCQGHENHPQSQAHGR